VRRPFPGDDRFEAYCLESGLPQVNKNASLGLAARFEIITGDTIIRVQAVKLNACIERKTMDWRGLRGLLFFQRPILD